MAATLQRIRRAERRAAKSLGEVSAAKVESAALEQWVSSTEKFLSACRSLFVVEGTWRLRLRHSKVRYSPEVADELLAAYRRHLEQLDREIIPSLHNLSGGSGPLYLVRRAEAVRCDIAHRLTNWISPASPDPEIERLDRKARVNEWAGALIAPITLSAIALNWAGLPGWASIALAVFTMGTLTSPRKSSADQADA